MNLPSQYTAWLDAMLHVARHYGIGASQESVRVSLAWERGAPLDTLLDHMARQLGLALRLDAFSASQLDPWRLPLVVEFDNGEVGVVRTTDGAGMLGVLLSGDQGLETALPVDEVCRCAKRTAILRPNTAVPDARVDDYIRPYRRDWFWSIALRDWRRYGDIVLASIFANVLALASTIFSMQIYDRVVPAQSEPTLWVLFGGVMLAVAFEFLLRMSRTHISDVIGKRADLKAATATSCWPRFSPTCWHWPRRSSRCRSTTAWCPLSRNHRSGYCSAASCSPWPSSSCCACRARTSPT